MSTIAITTKTKTATATETTTTTASKEKTDSSIKTNLNSVSNGCSLAALKQHITTCLQRWRQRHPTATERNRNKAKHTSEHQRQQHLQEGCQCECHCHRRSSGKWFRKYTRKDFFASSSFTSSTSSISFVQRTTVYCKAINAKLQKFIAATTPPPATTSSQQRSSTPTIVSGKGPRRYGRKVEIVAKLLSLNLIDSPNSTTSASESFSECNTSTEQFPSQRRGSADSAYYSIQDHLEIFESVVTSTTLANGDCGDCGDDSDKMTITDLTFLEIRDEYPDLDSEVRSILTARAQTGATISDIRDDYRKLTGVIFPIYEDVTNFLLTIPYVTAFCNEHGTRIFNIRPMEKTKHIHSMVLNQKTSQEQHVSKPYNSNIHRRYYREHQRNVNYQPNNWRQNTSFRRQQLTQQPHHQQQQQHEAHHHQRQQQQPRYPYNAEKDNLRDKNQKIAVINDKHCSQDESEGFVENNWYYNDNCNYLFNRMYSQDLVPPGLPNQAMIGHTDLSRVDENPQPTLVNTVQPLPPPSQTDYNNFNIPSYENNINYLNNLYQVQEQPITNPNNNIVVVNPRRSSIMPPPSYKGSVPRSSRSSSPVANTNESMFTDTDYEAHLLDFLLLGDDFLLYMARMELRCKFKKNQKVLQSGLCVSGQTINAAIKRITTLNDSDRSIIVNIGSVNIMQGRQLIQIQHEFRQLIAIMLKKGLKPILTTLAPLANYTHNSEIKSTLERFNEYIKREGERRNLLVIDIWKCLVNEKRHVMFDCYQNEPRTVTGTVEPYLFWNNIGRQRVLNLIQSQLEY